MFSPTPPQSPHWVDTIVEEILAWQKKSKIPQLHLDDMKTPSGRVHTGAIRGVALHDILAKVLASHQSNPLVSTYVFNDMDPMDGLPAYLDQDTYTPHMGKPLYKIPVPPLEKSGINITNVPANELAELQSAQNFAQLYAYDFMHAFRQLGCSQKIIWSHELYESGQMDGVIRQALDSVEKIRHIYKQVADYDLPPRWYPFQVICPQCGKVGSTLVTDWDGEQVTFECQLHKVEWAVGCEYQGKVSPFGGTGKLLWKMDWPAHWTVMGVNVEGAGKDHTSAGGSRDMANAIIQAVYNKLPPFDIPYEWILVRGAKMSSSKGVGTSAREFVGLFPQVVGRFLFVDRHYSQVIDFDPKTMAIPDLFDEYDQAARIFWEQEVGDQRLARSFELAHQNNPPAAQFLPRFRDVATWMQHPEINLLEKCGALKGSALTSAEQHELSQRRQYAQIWLIHYAPSEYQLTPGPSIPAATELSSEQRQYLATVATLLTQKSNWDPTELQQQLYQTAKNSLGAKAGFEAIYLAFLNKKAGPRAAWMLLHTDQTFVQQRLKEVSQASTTSTATHLLPTLSDSALFSFDSTFAQKYPSACVGLAVIRNVSVVKQLPELEQAKAELATNLQSLTTEDLGHFPELLSYRRLYKDMGIDWHSRRPSPEALLRRLAQKKPLYTINTCVDAYNLVVMKHRVSVGAFDYDQVQLPTVLKVANGGEKIHLLGDDEPTMLKAGEISYFDQNGPYNLDFNYRDAQRTCVTEQTTNLLINVDGIYDISRAQVEQSLQETVALIQKYCGGTVEAMGIVQV